MNSTEFVIWLKGFVAGSNNYNLTPSGWENIKEELNKVNDEELYDGPMTDVDPDCEECGGENLSLNDYLTEAARRYKEIIEEYDDYGQRIPKSKWHSTNTIEELKK